GAFSYLGKNIHQMEWQWYSRNELLDLIADKGVINTFDSSAPLYQQIANPDVEKSRYIVVRMFDDDPSHKTDSFVAQAFTKEVVEGSRILAKAIDAKGVVFVLSKKMNVQIEAEGPLPVLIVKTDGKKYPSGFKQNLVHIIRKAAKTSEQESFNSVNRFSLFVDPETLYSVYEAVVFGKPVLETFVHVEGSCLQTAAMLQVRIGTTIKSLVNQCGGFKTKPSKIIINGMITGCSVETLETAITRGVKSVAFVPAKELNDHRQNLCVRCGKCRLICPEEIYPDLMYRHCNGGKKVGKDMIATSILCSGCGLCNSICPSRLPLCQTIEQLRKNEYENK
ncbi:MAG: SLBB domain-containing protein, partial [Treponema sp.]|nr:SLBB domain-containing protein [Treponema sp.]